MFGSFGVLVFGVLVFGVLAFGVLAFRCFDQTPRRIVQSNIQGECPGQKHPGSCVFVEPELLM